MTSKKRNGEFPNLKGRTPGKTVRTRMREALPAAHDVILEHHTTNLLAAIAVVDYCREMEK